MAPLTSSSSSRIVREQERDGGNIADPQKRTSIIMLVLGDGACFKTIYLSFQYDSYACSCKERKKYPNYTISTMNILSDTVVIIKQHIEKKKRILTCVISAISRIARMTKKSAVFVKRYMSLFG
jgi:hypothetical protein